MAQEQKNKGASRLTKDEEDDLKQFLLHDMDRNGTVTAQEIIDFMEARGQQLSDEEKKERRDWVKLIDTNEDGAVSVEEFIAMMERSRMMDSTLELFKFFDKDGSGFLTKEEIRQAMKELGSEQSDGELDVMMKEYDTDGDGKINYEEFAKSLG
ncbi:uncharacterized protein LOC144870558 isoform X2 [Branchiostoma floridae x Branchiostoma japonicum]